MSTYTYTINTDAERLPVDFPSWTYPSLGDARDAAERDDEGRTNRPGFILWKRRGSRDWDEIR